MKLIIMISLLFVLLGCAHPIEVVVDEDLGKVFIVRNLHEEETLHQPYSFQKEEIGAYLEDVYYIYDQIFSWSAPKLLFNPDEREFLATNLVEAFNRAGPQDEVRFQTRIEAFRNQGSLVLRQNHLELKIGTFANDSFYEDHSYLEGFKAKWRLNPNLPSIHLKRPQWMGKDIVLYNTLKTPLAQVARRKVPKTETQEAKSETNNNVPAKSKEDKLSGSDIELEQKWLNEEIERAKREEEKNILSPE